MTTWTTAKADHENTGAAAPLRARPGPKWNGVTGNALRHSLNRPRPSIRRDRSQSHPLEQRLERLRPAERESLGLVEPGVVRAHRDHPDHLSRHHFGVRHEVRDRYGRVPRVRFPWQMSRVAGVEDDLGRGDTSLRLRDEALRQVDAAEASATGLLIRSRRAGPTRRPIAGPSRDTGRHPC